MTTIIDIFFQLSTFDIFFALRKSTTEYNDEEIHCNTFQMWNTFFLFSSRHSRSRFLIFEMRVNRQYHHSFYSACVNNKQKLSSRSTSSRTTKPIFLNHNMIPVFFPQALVLHWASISSFDLSFNFGIILSNVGSNLFWSLRPPQHQFEFFISIEYHHYWQRFTFATTIFL